MTHRHINIFTAVAMVIIFCVTAACSKDSFSDIQTPEQTANPTMGITIALGGTSSTRSAAAGGNQGYEIGEGLENYLDINNDNYRIYFFDENNKYVATFKTLFRPTVINGTEDVNGVPTYYYYEFRGEVPDDLPLKFKLVTLFNWPKYPEESSAVNSGTSGDAAFRLVKGVTTLQELCHHNDAQFNALTLEDENGTWLSESEQRFIPFFGVRVYDLHNYTTEIEIDEDGKEWVKSNVYINLNQPLKTPDNDNTSPTPLPLLRAMAKVEVILANPVITDFDEVVITRVNPRGCCAPRNATEHNDYDHGYDWENDFIRDVHLPVWDAAAPAESASSNAPDGSVITGLPMTRVKVDSEDGTQIIASPRRWIAYLPEYKNIGETAESGLCRIEVKLNGVSTFIYFSKDGKNTSDPNSSDRYNIERNNIYRFTINDMAINMSCQVDIQPFAEHSLEFTYGLTRDERGDLKVLPDANGIYPEYFTKFMQKNPKLLPKDIHTGLVLELTDGDYYAIVIGEYTAIEDAEVWLKDSEGCRILTNYSTLNAEDAQDCNSREVIYFFGVDQTIYNKDIHGDRRVYHFDNHNSIVISRDDKMYFKVLLDEEGNQLKRYPVESWDEVTHTGWIIAKEEISSDGKTIIATFHDITSAGVLGNQVTTVEIPFVNS